ncbi:MAG: heme o synthase [Chloroflexota bacterium]
MLGLVGTAAVLFAIQVIVGAAQIWTTLAAWAVSLHLTLGAAIWGLLVSATFVGWYAARAAYGGDAVGTGPSGRPVDEPSPASVPLDRWHFPRRAFTATRHHRAAAGDHAAGHGARMEHGAGHGSAGVRVARRLDAGGGRSQRAPRTPSTAISTGHRRDHGGTADAALPAHQVALVDGLMFGLILTVVSFGLLVLTTNLVAAFLTLLAIGFYVVVYTMLLKRSTPQNIVLGGAAGALPPVIGWAAVTGDITLPALLLFAIVFYWTPPHFWALSLRIRGDYAAANVPMLPVTHGVAETTRQIALYSVLMVALTLVFFAVAHMGLVFLAGTLALGTMFLSQAFLMWRDGTDARAVRLYKFSITYLTGLFALIVLDVAVFVPLG